MPTRAKIFALLLGLPLVGVLGTTRPAAGQDALREFTPARRRQAIDSIASLLRREYVSPDTGRLIAARLEEQERSGAYERAAGWPELARLLTADLRALNGDLHLFVGAAPPPSARASAAPVSDEEAARETARRTNYGFETVRRLEGNVGHLEMRGLYGAERAFARLDAALEILSATDAIILDLRESDGGSSEMANALVSAFLPGDSVLTLVAHTPSENVTEYIHTTARLRIRRRPSVPLYVLTSSGSQSADEHVAFVLKSFGRARLVGERTAGAGHMSRSFPVPPGLRVSLSTTRVFHPTTRAEWERVGVEPHVAVPAPQALGQAHVAALEDLASAERDTARVRQLHWVRDYVKAGHAPPPIAAELREAIAGSYAGERRISWEGGTLMYQRASGPKLVMRPMGGARFALTPAVQLELVRSGAGGQELRIETVDGTRATHARVP